MGTSQISVPKTTCGLAIRAQQITKRRDGGLQLEDQQQNETGILDLAASEALRSYLVKCIKGVPADNEEKRRENLFTLDDFVLDLEPNPVTSTFSVTCTDSVTPLLLRAEPIETFVRTILEQEVEDEIDIDCTTERFTQHLSLIYLLHYKDAIEAEKVNRCFGNLDFTQIYEELRQAFCIEE